ncbi:hypothetical protein EV426DRAFT_292622 [Tirmania nivea]|nr:hypothetical protein EV426DRAFT_292622 [Tirmania nivea]
MGCGKPSKIVPTPSTAATDKQQPVAVPRPASSIQQPNGTSISQRSSIPVLATKPRTSPPVNGNSHSTENDSLKENKTPPRSSTRSPPSSGPKRVNSRPANRVSNDKAREDGVSSPTGSVSSRNLKVQKRPRSRGTGDLLNSYGVSVGSGVNKSKTLLQERDMNGGNGTGDVSNNSTLSAGSTKPLRATSRKVTKLPKTTGGGVRGEGGKNSNPSLTSKPASLELVVVVDPEVEGKTRIPRPRQAYQLVDPRRYIRVTHSCEELREGTTKSGRSVSAAQPSTRKVSKAVPGQQPEARPRATRSQIQQRPRSMMLLGSPEANTVGVGSWATDRGAGGMVTA